MTQKARAGVGEIAKMWARLLQQGSLRLAGVPGRVESSADLRRINQLAVEMAGTLQRDPTSAAKYADYRLWVPFNACRVGALGLQNSSPQRLLDIGCGPGYFLAACRACGHDVYGIDAPENILTPTERRVYSELLGALALQDCVAPLLIERYIPMALRQTGYDLITAFWICFNRHRQPDEWSAEEWKFFVNDALQHLRPQGVLHLELNANPERYGAAEFYDAATLEYFRSVGTVERGLVRIRKDTQAA
jgi:SAM-dependent methyltransferase